MVSIPGLSNTLGIIGTAAKVLNDDSLNTKLAQGKRVVDRVDRAGSAITSFAAQTTILSRVFIDETVMNEPVLAHTLRCVHEWYAAQVISALQLSQLVSDGRTVQSVMGIVQTGHNQHQNSVLSNIIEERYGRESFLANYLGESMSGVPLDGIAGTVALEAMNPDEDKKSKYNGLTMKSVAASEHRIGPMGELFEVTIQNPNGNGGAKVPVFIQMQPTIIPTEAAPRFIDMNVAPSLWQRWTQMRSGELSFWKDFVLNRDLHRRQKTVLKDQRTSQAFTDFLKTVAKKDSYALADVSNSLGSTQSSNLANSVIIFSEETVAQAKMESGIDLHHEASRNAYFRDTYSMIVVIVDAMHQRVTIYFNGLDGELNLSYAEFKPRDSKFDPQEMMGALAAFSTNNIGRMR
jgi:hypothetical protein